MCYYLLDPRKSQSVNLTQMLITFSSVDYKDEGLLLKFSFLSQVDDDNPLYGIYYDNADERIEESVITHENDYYETY